MHLLKPSAAHICWHYWFMNVLILTVWIQIISILIGSTLFAFTYIGHICSRRRKHTCIPFSGENFLVIKRVTFKQDVGWNRSISLSKLTDKVEQLNSLWKFQILVSGWPWYNYFRKLFVFINDINPLGGLRRLMLRTSVSRTVHFRNITKVECGSGLRCWQINRIGILPSSGINAWSWKPHQLNLSTEKTII